MSEIPEDVLAYLEVVGRDTERARALHAVFSTVNGAMPAGYSLGMHFGMPGWVVPLDVFPVTYNKKPLSYVSLGATKNYNSLYLMALYGDSGADARFRAAWAATGRSLDMGKSCLRFRSLADLDLGLIADTVRSVPVNKYLATYQRIKGARS